MKLTSDFANTSEAVRIGDRFLFDSFAKNSSPCNFRLLQQYRGEPDTPEWRDPGSADAPSETRVASEGHRMGATLYLELAEDGRNMVAHGLLADVEPRSDLIVVEALGHDLEDLPLTRREVIESGQG